MALPDYIPNAEVFITVKTYPTLSRKHGELVCTAGICNGHFVRMYPIKYRNLEDYEQYTKFQWIKVNLRKRPANKDRRMESYSPEGNIVLGAKISAGPKGWADRMRIIHGAKIHDNLEELIRLAKSEPFVSLAALRPKKILDFTIEASERDWTEQQKAYYKQMDLFEEIGEPPEKIPYTFSYKFTTEDNKTHKLMIEDWETGMLYRHCLKNSGGDEAVATQKVKEKYLSMAANPNLFFFVGTTYEHHWTAPNPFIIIGVASPLVNITMQQGELSFL